MPHVQSFRAGFHAQPEMSNFLANHSSVKSCSKTYPVFWRLWEQDVQHQYSKFTDYPPTSAETEVQGRRPQKRWFNIIHSLSVISNWLVRCIPRFDTNPNHTLIGGGDAAVQPFPPSNLCSKLKGNQSWEVSERAETYPMDKWRWRNTCAWYIHLKMYVCVCASFRTHILKRIRILRYIFVQVCKGSYWCEQVQMQWTSMQCKWAIL